MGNVTLFLMSAKGLASLEALVDAGLSGAVSAVVAARDRNVVEDKYEEIVALCDAAGIARHDRGDAGPVASEYAIAVSWRWMIDPGESRLVVLHDSPLPRYRGFGPLVSMLVNGEEEIGVTAIFANEEFDRGDVIARRSVSVSYPLKISEAIGLISPLYADLVVWIVSEASAGRPIAAEPQDEADASYSLWRDDLDYDIDWSWPADRIRRFVDAVGHPYLGARSVVDGREARILGCRPAENIKIENRDAGKVIWVRDGKPFIVCGEGLLEITEMTDGDGVSMLPLRKTRVRFVGR